jgi:hypothetical protein
MYATGTSRDAIYEDRAGTTDTHATAEFTAGELEVIAKDPKKGFIRLYLDIVILTVDVEVEGLFSHNDNSS